MDRQDSSSWQLFSALCCWLASLYILVWNSLLEWALRDGLGPDVVESHGLLALSRFWGGIRWPLCLYVIPNFLAGCLLYWLDSRRSVQRSQHSAKSAVR